MVVADLFGNIDKIVTTKYGSFALQGRMKEEKKNVGNSRFSTMPTGLEA